MFSSRWLIIAGVAISLILLLVVTWRSEAGDHPTPYGERQDVQRYVDELVREHQFDRDALDSLFAQTAQRQDIIDRISKPAEKVWEWHRYRGHLVDEDRIDQGVAFWQQHADTLARAEATYGVAPEVVLAILGIETRYGKITGGFRVVDALTTLGFDYPPRSDFFRKELTHLLLLAREEGKAAEELYGSYAGAMGFGQFIPSSYRHYAVDFDEDGVRDIWANPVDAIGSVANYFSEHRWRAGEQVTVLAQLNDQAEATALDAIANQSLDLQHTAAELEALGIEMGELPADTPVALFRMQAEQGTQYWVGLHNFHVITRYNRSRLYALAVHELSQAIKARYEPLLAKRF